MIFKEFQGEILCGGFSVCLGIMIPYWLES